MIRFKIGNKVISTAELKKDMLGVVWKVTSVAVYVKFGSGVGVSYGRFYFRSIKLLEMNVSDLKIIES